MTKARDIASAAPAPAGVTSTELGYIDGVTSAIQTQMDAKLATSTAASTYVPNSLADAKGDLIVGTADNTISKLALGSNGQSLVADSTTTTGLRWQDDYAAGKNVLINGNFDIWQRGTSFSTQPTYTADRWYNYQSSGITVSRQSTNPPSGSQYVLRQTVTAGGGYLSLHQYIETANVAALWGKTVTFSIKLRRSATFDATMFVDIQKTGTVDGGSGATWVQIANTSIGSATITSGTSTSDWTTLSVTAAIPADGTANGLYVRLGYLTNPANGSYIEAAQAQLEVGSVVTPFSRAGGTIQGELAACQRYYWRNTAPNSAGNQGMASGISEQTTNAQVILPLPVVMRVRPTAVDWSAVAITDTITYTTLATNVTIESGTSSVIRLSVAVTGQTQYRPVQMMLQQNGFLGLTAEL